MKFLAIGATWTFLLLAGCSDANTNDDPLTNEPVPSLPPGAPSENVPPPRVEVLREIHNQSYRFPSGPTDPTVKDDFVVSDDAINLTVVVQWFVTCPAGASLSAKVIIRDPSGEETESPHTTEFGSSGAEACVFDPTASSVWRGSRTDQVESVTPGDWAIESSGQFGGTVLVVVTESYLDEA